MKDLKQALLLVLCLTTECLGRVDYTGHQLVRVRPRTPEQVEVLQELQKGAGVDFWRPPVQGRPVEIRVGPSQAADLMVFFNQTGLETELVSANIQQLIEGAPMVKGGQAMDWTAYHPIEDIYSYWDYLEATYSWVSTESIGKSHDGQDMRIIKVCKHSDGCGHRPAMWFDGGIHANEWISPATATYMARELVEKDEDHPDLTESLDWYILPVFNPDGYLYTQTDDRMWRKTRSPNAGSPCVGTDPNRNWGFHWNDGDSGSSSDPCDKHYMGSGPFAEIEIVNVSNFLLKNREQIKFYMNIHSYGEMILLPWGWTDEKPDNIDNLTAMALLGRDAMQANYEVGCIPCLLYPASGSSVDWALGEAGIPYSYGMELRDTGMYGFLLPPSQIIPTGMEAWAFHRAVARRIIQEFVPQ